MFREQVQGGGYTPPKLEIYTGSVRTACGMGSAAMGPFYCPGDSKVYIDPVFFDELAQRHKAAGDFAQAYVIAHEVAHHVQNLTGYSDRVNEVRAQGDEIMTNQMSVRLELQADYLAGVWAHFADKDYNILEAGDIQEGINAANRIGDDTLQKESQGYVRPERFTHGTSAQRAYWFKKGLKTGSFALQESNGISRGRQANVKAHHFRDTSSTRIPATTGRTRDNVGHYSVARYC